MNRFLSIVEGSPGTLRYAGIMTVSLILVVLIIVALGGYLLALARPVWHVEEPPEGMMVWGLYEYISVGGTHEYEASVIHREGPNIFNDDGEELGQPTYWIELPGGIVW